ncbi:MAG TPA: hypothetical protein VGB05_07915 [Pyrinomonadaceae bacterium]|jgi:hypothetical protein
MKSFYKNFRESIAGRLRTHFMEKEQLEDIAYAMVQMLKTPLQQSRSLAREGAAQRAQLNKLPRSKNLSLALDTLRGMPVPLDVPEAVRELETQAATDYLLALPFSVSALSLLAHLVRDTRRRFCIVDTRFTRYYFHPFSAASETRERVQLLSSSDMLAHYRGRLERRARDGAAMPDGEAQASAPDDAATDGAVTYVTFPDLQTTSLDTARRVPFLGEDYQFSTLEPLLFFRGLAPLFTFDARDFATTRRLKLVAHPPASERAVGEADVDALLAWLVGHMEQVFRQAPADMLSWTEAQMLSYSSKAITVVMKLKMTEGYVRAWKAADPNFKDETFVRSIAELQKAQETIDKERLGAVAAQG